MGALPDVSIQETTFGGVGKFLDAEEFACLASIKLLTFLAGALLRYEEEGVLLTPRLILCSSIEDLSRSLPGAKFYRIGKEAFGPASGKRVLKDYASLAKEGWIIFVERRSAENMEYGVLTYLESPTSISLREMITIDASILAVLVERVDNSIVRFVGSRGTSLDIAFSTSRESGSDSQSIEKFVSAAVANVYTPELATYMTRLIEKLLALSHGTIMIVLGDSSISTIVGMSDAVELTPPHNLAGSFSDYRISATADSLLSLQRAESLLLGVIQSDGIVAFDTSGRVTAYRVFFKPADAEVASADKPKEIGGARRRAFSGLRPLIGTSLKAALFRSQDGRMEYTGS